MKINITLSIDKELKERAKEENMILSHFLNEQLKEHFASDPRQIKEFKAILDEHRRLLDLSFKKLDSWTEIYNNHVETNRKEKFDRIIKNVPEIADLTDEQLEDSKLMAKFVDKIRQEYGIRISITEIRKLRGIE